MNVKRIPLSLAIGGALGLLCAAGQAAGLFDIWSSLLTDRFFLPHPADPSAVIVAIDDESLGRIGRWPWDRNVHARLVDRLSSAGASVIAYDVNFPEPSNPSSDQALAEAFARGSETVLPAELTFSLTPRGLSYDPEKIVRPIPALLTDTHSGFSNVPLDIDGVARRLPLRVEARNAREYAAFAWIAAELAGRTPDASEVPLDRYGRMTINFPNAPGEAFPTLVAADVLEGDFATSTVAGKVVFVGATARDLHDEQLVATSRGEPMSGVEIHASIYDTIVQRRWLMPVPLWLQALLLVLAGLLLGFIVPVLRARLGFLVAVLLWVTWIVTAFVIFDRGYVLDIVWPSLLVVFGYVALVLERWVSSERERRQLRGAFSRYVSANVVDSLMKDPAKLKLGGQRRNMSVLFSDLRGFTTLSEGLRPEELVEVLNKYLDEMTNIVFEEGGTLDKYIGDAVMAFWNAPLDQDDHAKRAVRTAIRMRNTLDEMNKTGAFPKGIELKVGVGINSGDMVVGNIGGERRYDYTVIGDSVNLASRTEGLCKEYGVQIIVTENTKAGLDDTFVLRPLDKVAVKGKKEPILIYHVMGLASEVTDAEQKLSAQFAAAFERYLDREFGLAIEDCLAILSVWPEDVPTKNLLERAEAFKKTPPPDDWVGTWVMTKK